MKAYQRKNIRLAQNLRKELTPWERKLWYLFLRDYPLRFQRQKAIGSAIADFYCAKAALVIELDGGEHYTPEQEEHDRQRTEALEKSGVTVIRFSNLDVDRNFPGVCEMIDREVQKRRKDIENKESYIKRREKE